MRYALNLILFLIVFTAVRTPKQVVWVVGAYVTGAAVAAAYGLLSPPPDTVYHDVSRVTGTLGDPNELAAALVPGTVLGAGLAIVLKRAPALRLLAGAAAVLCAFGVFLTLSRGGLIAMGVALAVSLVAAGRWRAQALVLTVLVCMGGLVFFGWFASNTAVDRVTKFEGGTGRTDLWTIGRRMAADNPVGGVGVGNFQTASVHYLLAPGGIKRDEFIVDKPKAAHNTYLQVLTELGVIGLSLFLAIIAFSLGCIVRAARTFERLKDPGMELLTRALLVAVAGMLAADFFISQQFSKQLWLLLGLGPGLLGVANVMLQSRADDDVLDELEDADWRPDARGAGESDSLSLA